MNTKQLRQKILDLAIRGQLVPQDNNDEPASVLLEKIRAEKQTLIEQKKIKKDKKSSYITCDLSPYQKYTEHFADGSSKNITDEIPFEIPKNWAWCRLGEIGNWAAGSTPSRKEIKYYQKGIIPWLKTGDLNDSFINETSEFITELAIEENTLRLNPIGSVLIAMYGATTGKLGLLNIEATTNQACCACIPFSGINNRFLFFYLLSQKQNIQEKAEGGAQPNISKEKLINILFPLPPLSEQRRIVEKIEELLALVDDLETNKTDLQSYIKQAKSKVLEMAIRGELVPKNPEDEPASVLLERIKKEQKSSKSKGKNTAHNTHYEEELPFDIPENWAWCRLGEVCEKIETGNSINAKIKETKYKNLEEGFPYIGTKDISENHYIKYDNGIKIPFLEKFKVAKKNSILLCIEGGSAGRKIGITNRDVCFGNKLAKFYSHNISNSYILFFLMSEQFKSQFKESISGLIGGVSINKLGQFVLPLPPLSEQHRIVEKIEEIFSELEFIEENLI